MPVQTTIRVRQDTAANWTSTNPTLALGERGYETDTKLYKTGDGATAWVSLGYETIGESQVTNLVTDLAAKTDQNANLANLNMGSNVVDVFDRVRGFTGTVFTSGYMVMTFFTPIKTMTITQLSSLTVNIAGASLTGARMGLYTFDETTATLVARTANDTTMFTSTHTLFTRSLDTTGGYPASYTLQAGNRYGFAIWITGTTMPNFITYNLVGNGALTILTPRLTALRVSQSDLAASYLNSGFVLLSTTFWGRLS